MKVYIVEMYGLRGSHRYGAYSNRYGVYSNIELARNKLQEIFRAEKLSRFGTFYKVELVNENCFVVKHRNKTEEYYEITEVEVEDGNK